MLYAEALNECAATADAVAIINDQIRARAWGWNLPEEMKWDSGMSQEDFRKNILDERMRELMAEMWRRYDLIRTGKYVEYTNVRNKWAKSRVICETSTSVSPFLSPRLLKTNISLLPTKIPV